MRDAVAWYVVVQVAAIAVWPAVTRALAPLDDRGWAAGKAIGALGVAWVAWLICMLTPVPFTRVTLLLILIAIGAAAWAWQLRAGGFSELLVWARARRRL